MRRYEIKITDQDGNPKEISGFNGGTLFNGTFTSTADSAGLLTIPGALNVEWDLPISVYNSPLGGAFLRVYGVGLPLMAQAANFNPSPDGKTYCNIEISGGMAKGLPLAVPSQYGILMKSRIQQAFGNWQGTSQTLDFIMLQPAGSRQDPYNFSFTCESGTQFSVAIKNTLQSVFPNVSEINVNVSENLVAPETIVAQNFTLTDFAKFLNTRSLSIINNPNYPGIQLSYENNVINVFDYTVPATAEPIQIEFTDLIGQPTWIGPQTLTFKTVMRFDLKVGGQIKMPELSSTLGLILTTAQSQSQYRNVSDFQGVFNIQMVRHIGLFRQADANSWVTVVQAYTLPTA